MQPANIMLPCQMAVGSETEVIAVRQRVRQVAREHGIGLTQQARLTAAITTVARLLVASGTSTVFGLQLVHQPYRALEISCTLPASLAPGRTGELGRTLHVEEIRPLVDDASLTHQGSVYRLTLLVRLPPSHATAL